MSEVSSLKDDLEGLKNQGSDIRPAKKTEDWRVIAELDDVKGGFFNSKPREGLGSTTDLTALFAEFDLNPNDWIVTSVRRSRWQVFGGEWLEAARVNLIPASAHSLALEDDIEGLTQALTKWKPPKRSKVSTGALAEVFGVGDTQWGKDAGDGTDGTIDRMMFGLEEALACHHERIKIGRQIGTIVLPQLGDCIEGSTSQKGGVLLRSDRTITQQVRLGHRMLLLWVKAFAPLTEKLIVCGVGGNHDEVHRQGITDPIDSWQIEVMAIVEGMCRENPALDHVQFRYPSRDNGTMAINLGGQILGIAHGHQFKSTGIATWLANQAAGRTPVGDSDVLLTAHYHHYKAGDIGHRFHVQIPAMDGGSPWFRDRNGLDSPTGIVSFLMGEGYDPRRDQVVLARQNRGNR